MSQESPQTPSQPRFQALERCFFAGLNRYAEPLLRRGVASHCLAPAGVVVLEHEGRRSGTRYRTPLAAIRFGRHFVVSTYRGGRSHWVRNLAARTDAGLWVGGQARTVTASVIDSNALEDSSARIPEALHRPLTLLTNSGWTFAVLTAE